MFLTFISICLRFIGRHSPTATVIVSLLLEAAVEFRAAFWEPFYKGIAEETLNPDPSNAGPSTLQKSYWEALLDCVPRVTHVPKCSLATLIVSLLLKAAAEFRALYTFLNLYITTCIPAVRCGGSI